MLLNQFPVIDLPATGANIRRLRQNRGLSVRDLQQFFGFEEPQAIYKWQRGQSLPSVDNLYALSTLLEVPMNDILVSANLPNSSTKNDRPKPIVIFLVFIFSGAGGMAESRSRLDPYPPSGLARLSKEHGTHPETATCQKSFNIGPKHRV